MTLKGKATHDVSYAVYYSSDLDVSNGNVPLVMCFHGKDNTALYEAQATEWPLIGKTNGFITVSVDGHYPNVSATETIDLINHIKSEYSIDPTRIYATGFSIGEVKSWNLFEQYPKIFADLSPQDASLKPGTDIFLNTDAKINTDTLVPVFYVGGEASPLPELPCQSKNLVERVQSLFKANQVVASYDVSFDSRDTWENPIWDVDGDYSYVDPDTKYFKKSVLKIETFKSKDGNTYTALASASNQAPCVIPRNSYAAWNFLKQFTRQEDGTIKIVK